MHCRYHGFDCVTGTSWPREFWPTLPIRDFKFCTKKAPTIGCFKSNMFKKEMLGNMIARFDTYFILFSFVGFFLEPPTGYSLLELLILTQNMITDCLYNYESSTRKLHSKVRTFWKGHKNLKQSPTWFDSY